MYRKDQKLKLTKLVRITKEEYQLLKAQKKKQGISMAKIVCNLILERYGDK